tara:strand:+ start:89 stop:733 length:645 start_codon:yes stop_codon:yes gene_type:complete
MKNIIIFILLFISIIFVFLYFFDYNYFANLLIKDQSIHKYYSLFFIFVSFLYFLTPLPVTLIIIANGYFFQNLGFIISIFQVVLCSILIFSIAKKIDKYFDFTKYKNKILKKININKFSESNYSIILSRYIFPYFFHNIYYGILNIKLKKFSLLVILSEIPMLYALNSIGKSMINFDFSISISIFTLFLDKNFYIPFLIIFVIFVVTSYLYKIK